MTRHERVRVAISMRRDDYEELKTLATTEGQSVSAYLRKAVATHRYIQGRVADGAKVLIEERGTQREVVFR